jgi:drug/metabolite transporter (DMT)-like permease
MGTAVDDTVTPGHATSATRPGVWLTDLSLLLMTLIWGVNFSVVKYGTQLVDPLAYNGVRVALAAVSLVLIVVLSGAEWPSRLTMLILLGLGALGNGLYQLFFVEGIARTRAGDAALLTAASPALIALIGRVRGLERIRPRGMVGIGLSMLGIALVVFGTAHGNAQHATLVGDFLILCGSLCWAIYTVLLKPHTHDIGGIQLSALTMVGGAIPLLVVAAPAIAHTRWSAMPATGWGAVAYSGLGALVVAYLFWYRGVRVLGPTRTAMYSNLQPALGVFLAWAMLNEAPTPWQLVGVTFIISGLLLTRA